MPAPLEVWTAKMQHWKQNTYPAISLTSFATPLASLQRNFAKWWWLYFFGRWIFVLLFILDPVHRMTWLWCQTCCWCCTWWACCPCPRTRPGCRLARRQRSSPTQTSEGSPMSWSMKSSVSKTHDNKLTVNLYLVAGPGIPNNQLSVQRPADLLIVVKIKMSHFFSMSQQLSHLCTKFAFPIISTLNSLQNQFDVKDETHRMSAVTAEVTTGHLKIDFIPQYISVEFSN